MTGKAAHETTRADPCARVLSLIVPVYKNEASLPSLLARLSSLPRTPSVELRVVFVIDGSPDGSEQFLRSRLETWDLPATLIVLSRNFGAFAAVRAGLKHADGDYFAVMAADLQEPVELLLSFVERLETGEVDLVLGERTGRDDPAMSRFAAAIFWWLYRRFVQPTMPKGGVDVFACNQAVRTTILGLNESNSSLVGQLLWVGFRQETVGYRRLPRTVGKSAWTLQKRMRYMTDSIFSFTDLPIRTLLFVGFSSCITVILLGIAVAASWAFGDVSVPGYTPLMLSVLFVGGAVTFGLGVVGTYVWRTFENTKQRPLLIERSIESYPRGAGE